MNVTIKPLVWREHPPVGGGSPRYSTEAFGNWFVVEYDYADYTEGGRVAWMWCGVSGPEEGAFETADAAKLAVERWHTTKVLECLEPVTKGLSDVLLDWARKEGLR